MADIFNTQLDLLKAVTPNAGGASYLEVQTTAGSSIIIVPSGTQDVNLTKVGGTATSLGQKTSANSLPVVIASDQSSVPVTATISGTPNVNVTNGAGASAVNIQDGGNSITVDGSVTVTQATGTNLHTVLDSGTLTSITNALPSGTNVIGHVIADTGSTTAVTGNVTVVQPTGTNLHTVTDSGSTTAVTGNVTVVQPTGTNLHTVLDSGTLTSITNALPSGTNVIGHVIADSGSTTAVTGNVTVVQPTGTSLHAVIDSGSTTAVTGNVTVVQPTGTNLHTVLDSGTLTSITNAVTVSQPTAANLNATVTGTVTSNQGGAPWSFNQTQVNGVAVSTGNGIAGTGTQRVTIASDNTAFTVNAAQATASNLNATVVGTGTFAAQVTGTVTANQGGAPWSQNITQVGGSSLTLGQKAAASSIPVVTQLDSSPATQNITVQDTASTTTSGFNSQSFITGTPTTNSTASFTIASFNTAIIQATGTWTGTIQTEVSFDGGTTWFIRGIKQSGVTYVSSAFTSNFQGQMGVAGCTNIRVRATAAMTGTATVLIVATVNVESAVVINPIALKDSTTQSITSTIKAASTAAAATDTAIVVALSPNSTGIISTKTDLTPSSPTAATVGTSSAQALAANANRKGLILVNTSANTISVGLGSTAVLNSGITLYPGGTFQMDEFCFDLGAVNSIASAASSNLAIQEFTT